MDGEKNVKGSVGTSTSAQPRIRLFSLFREKKQKDKIYETTVFMSVDIK